MNTKKNLYDDAWLGLGDLSKIEISENLMINRNRQDIEKPDAHLLRILINPKYLAATAKL